MAVAVALFVSKRLMPVAAAVLLLASGRLALALTSSQADIGLRASGVSAGEVRVVIGR